MDRDDFPSHRTSRKDYIIRRQFISLVSGLLAFLGLGSSHQSLAKTPETPKVPAIDPHDMLDKSGRKILGWFEQEESINRDFLTEIATEGHLRFPKWYSEDFGSMRKAFHRILIPCPEGFQRARVDFRVDFVGRTLWYTVLDVEINPST